MKKYYGTRFNSSWDSSTWMIILLTAGCCIAIPFFSTDDIKAPLVICFLMLIWVITTFKSVYYKIDGNQLIVYQFFIPKAYPIDKIKEIRSTRDWRSAPATSITNRIAIYFSDKSILKGTMPLIISPVRMNEFVSILKDVNPGIIVSELNSIK